MMPRRPLFLAASAILFFLCVQGSSEARKETKSDDVASLKTKIQRLDAENQMLSRALANATLRVHEAKQSEGAPEQVECLAAEPAQMQNDVSTIQPQAGNEDQYERPKEEDYSACEVLKQQNDSLRETIRAQNHYLTQMDGTSRNINGLSDENAQMKGKLALLEDSVKSSLEEIKKLMILNAALQKEIEKKNEILTSTGILVDAPRNEAQE